MHEMENGPQDPHLEDDGEFIPTEELETWWNGIKRKLPQIFKPDDVFYPQHAFGTKLMFYFDNGSNKPIRLIVLGSRMIPEYTGHIATCPGFQDKTPKYIVQHKEASHYDLSLVDYLAAHAEEDLEEGEDQDMDEPIWRKGWDDDGAGETDKEFEKLLDIIQQRKQKGRRRRKKMLGILRPFNGILLQMDRLSTPFGMRPSLLANSQPANLILKQQHQKCPPVTHLSSRKDNCS